MVGEHTLTAVATDDKGAQTTSSEILIIVTPKDTPPVNKPPVATLMATVPSKVLVGDTINFEFSATDSDGQISSLELLENGIKVSSATSASGSFLWTASALGIVKFAVR